MVGEVVPYLAAADVLEPLDDYPEAHALPIHPALGQAGSFRGGAQRPLVVVPFNRSTPIAYVNQHLFGANHSAQSWGELRNVARALTRPWALVSGCSDRLVVLGCARRASRRRDIVEADGRVSLGGTAGVAALGFLQQLVASDGTMKQPPGRDYNAWEQLSQDFLAGRVAMIWSSTAFVRYLEETADFPIRALPLPRGERAAVPTGGTHFVLLKSAPREIEASGVALRTLSLLDADSAAFWSSETGYLPVTLDAAKKLETSGFYAQHPPTTGSRSTS